MHSVNMDMHIKTYSGETERQRRGIQHFGRLVKDTGLSTATVLLINSELKTVDTAIILML